MRNNSGIIGSRQTISSSSASGLFSLIDQQINRGAGLWPITSSASLYSIFFDGSGDYLSIPASTSLSLDADFTIECWLYLTSNPADYQMIISSSDGNEYLSIRSTQIEIVGLSATVQISFSSLLTANLWHHLAMTRSGSTVTAWLDGKSLGTSTSKTGTLSLGSASLSTYVGRWGGATQYNFPGYISNLRVTKGTAIYTSNFTLPIEKLEDVANTSLLLGTTGSITDASIYNHTLTITGQVAANTTFAPHIPASIYLDGTGDYMTFPATGNFAKDAFFGSGKTFTVEAWIYPTSLVTQANYFSIILGDGNPTGSEMCWNVGMNDAKKPAISWYDGAAKSASVSTALTLNVWTHVAWIASAGSVSIYVNGVSQALTGTTTLTNSSQSIGMEIGVDRSRTIAGYISNLRAVKGTAIYTSNFTPSTTNLTNVSNTSILLGQYQAFALDFSSNALTITKSGNATYSTSVLPF